MAACNQTDIPVLNIQEDPCIQGSLSTNCIFYGLAIAYLGTQDSTNFADTLGHIVAKLEAGNNLATDLEEINRAQSLLIEELQESISESLITLSEIQVLLDECCPEPTTTSTTTSVPTTSTTTIYSTTTTTPSSTIWFGKFSNTNNKYEVCFGGNWSSANVYTTVSSGPFAPGTPLYTNQSLTTLWPTNGVMSINDVAYTIVNGYTVGAGEPCSSTTTSTTTVINQTAGSYVTEYGVGVALYNADGTEAGKYWTVGNNYSQFTNIPAGQYLGIGTTLYFDVACTQQWTFPLIYLVTGVTDQYNINPYTVIWKVENGVVTENFGQFVNKAYSVFNGSKVQNDLVPCNEFLPNGVFLDNGYTALMPGINVYSAQGSAITPVPLSYNYITDGTNVYTIVNNVLTSPQPCSGITTTTSTTTTTTTPTTTTTTTVVPSLGRTFAYGNPVTCEVGPGVPTTTVYVRDNVDGQNLAIGTGLYADEALTTYFRPFGNTSYEIRFAGNQYTVFAMITGEAYINSEPVPCTTTTTTTVAVPGSYILGTTGISPWDIVLDSEGNVYTSNVSSKSVSKITPDGTSTILGTTGEIPRGITIDTQGNIYVINSGDNTVTKITPSGVSTILGSAGTGANDIAVDQQGNVYVNNNGPNTVTKITPQGVSTTFASVASNPQCITIDAQGNVYTASPNVVNKITPSGVSTILGNTLYHPLDIIVDDLGNVYVSTAGNQVVKITPSGVSTSLGYVGSSPYGIALDSSGNVYTSNALSDNVSKITPDGVITVIATTGLGPMAIVVDPAGNVYTANSNSNNVTKIVQAPTTTTTIAPTTTTTTTVAPGTLGLLGDAGDGPKSIVLNAASDVFIAAQNSSRTFKFTTAGLDNSYGISTNPEDLAIDQSGNVYAVTTINNNIIKILPNGTSSIFATLPSQGYQITIDSLGNIYTLHPNQNIIYKTEPNGTVTNFGSITSSSYSLVTDSQNNIYVTNLMDKTIFKFTPSGNKTTFATLTANPRQITVDTLDNLYVSTNSNTVLKITPSGVVNVMATLGTNLQELTVDASGNVYVTDIIFDKIYKITPSGTVTDLVTMSGMYNPIATDSNYVYFGISSGNTYKIKL